MTAELEPKDLRWAGIESLLCERAGLEKGQWPKRRMELNTKRTQVVGEFERYKKETRKSPLPKDHDEWIAEITDRFIRRHELELAILHCDFQIALLGSKFNPRLFTRFLLDFQVRFSNLPEGDLEELGVNNNLDFYQEVAEKLGIFSQ